jgi:hypothetical protein
MTDKEEIKVVEEQEEKQYNAFEQKCMDAGWKPGGKKTAEDWALDGLSIRNEKITDLYKISEDLKDMMSKQEKAIYEKAQAEFKQQRDEAIVRGDINQVREIEQQQREMKEQNELHFQANEFIKRNNDWYNGNSYECLQMRKAAIEADNTVGGSDPADHYRRVEEFIKGKFSNYFNEGAVEDTPKRASAVEGSKSSVVRTSKKSYSLDDLNEAQKAAAKKYDKLGIMTVDEYIKEQLKAGYLK